MYLNNHEVSGMMRSGALTDVLYVEMLVMIYNSLINLSFVTN